jgi:hypothetical protein
VFQHLPENDTESVARHAEFERELQAFGWTVGRNLRIAHRYGGVDANRIANDAVDVVAESRGSCTVVAPSKDWCVQQETDLPGQESEAP